MFSKGVGAGLVECVLLVVCSLLRAAASSGHPPHIVIVMADDLGWNDVSFHGSAQVMTPNIDALAYQGVILNRHYAQPSCSPSRAALLTGRYPAHTGVQVPFGAGSSSALPLNFTILPEHLSRLGYRSHLVGKWHLGSHSSRYLPTRRGFHSHFGFRNGYLGYFDGIHQDKNIPGIDAWRDEAKAWKEFVGHYATDLFTQEATSIISSHNVSDGPLFLQVALSAPHTGNRGSELEVQDLGENERRFSYIKDLHRRLYAGMVKGVDDAVGAIVEALGSRQLLNDSIVLFMSDNGAPTLDSQWNYTNYGSNWPLRGMKMSCHEGGVRVAAALWSRLVAGGRVSDQLMHIADWLPTLYTAAGGAVEDLGQIDGVSQWEALRDEQSEAQRTEVLIELNNVNGNEALIRWPWKIVKYKSDLEIHHHAGQSGRWSEVPQYSVTEVLGSRAARAIVLNKSRDEILTLRSQATIDKLCPLVLNNSFKDLPCVDHYCLFNLESDPCETEDLSNLHQDIVSDLVNTLDGYRKDLVPSPPPSYNTRSDPQLWGNYWAVWADDSANLASFLRWRPIALLLPFYLAISL